MPKFAETIICQLNTKLKLKQNDFFKNMDLIRLARLSVGKVTETEFYKICDLGGVKL